MKNSIKSIFALALAGMAMTSCTDEIQLGDAFLGKAPGGTLNMDSIFSNADYVNQYLTGIYNKQYYGLPYKHVSWDEQNARDHYVGKLDAVTDLYQMHWSGCRVWSGYYTANLTAKDTPLISFSKDDVWETVHMACLIKENIDRVPNMDEHTRNYIVAQATALQAFAYSILLPHYGGLPIVRTTISQGDVDGGAGVRATFEDTVDFICELCDAAAPYLYWSYSGTDAETSPLQTGRWTKAGVMALKAQVLWLAASPLYNGDPYFGGQTEAEQQNLVGYGSYDQNRWTRAKNAFDDFWKENEKNGNYWHLYEASKKTSDGYRIAYRRGYIQDDSPENIHWTKTCDYYGTQGTYAWLNWNTWSVNRNNHSPSVEYIEMFPWSDGKPFVHDKDMKLDRTDIFEKDGKSEEVEVYTCLDGSGANVNDKLFYTYKAVRGGFNKSTSRDPRLYENARVSGVPEQLNYQTDDGSSSGNIMELWVGGQQAGTCVKALDGSINENLTSYCPTGFAAYKYVLSQAEYWRDYDMHWNVLTIPDMILMYAECLAETGDLPGAITQVDKIRARVGLKGLVSCNNDKNLTSNKDNLIEEILRERACELGMTNARYIDMIRRKRTDWMTKQLHGMATYRMIKNAQNKWVRRNAPWFGDDKNGGMAEPSRFEYEFFELFQGKRALWEYANNPNDPEVLKWLMMPFPQDEVNKGYGLIQNPGW